MKMNYTGSKAKLASKSQGRKKAAQRRRSISQLRDQRQRPASLPRSVKGRPKGSRSRSRSNAR